MKKGLGVSPILLSFENLGELLSTVEESIEFQRETIRRFDDHLGHLLRNNGNSSEAQAQQAMPTAMESTLEKDSEEQASPETPGEQQERAQQQQQQQKKRRWGTGKGQEDGSRWITLEVDDFALRIADGSAATRTNVEISALFQIVESLKLKLKSLEASRKLLANLPAQGFREDQRFLVVFKEGVPRQVIPTEEIPTQNHKFRYADRFQMVVLK